MAKPTELNALATEAKEKTGYCWKVRTLKTNMQKGVNCYYKLTKLGGVRPSFSNKRHTDEDTAQTAADRLNRKLIEEASAGVNEYLSYVVDNPNGDNIYYVVSSLGVKVAKISITFVDPGGWAVSWNVPALKQEDYSGRGGTIDVHVKYVVDRHIRFIDET